LPLLSSSTGLVFNAFLPDRETRELRALELSSEHLHPLQAPEAYEQLCETDS
jgi:DNA-binding IclR family transcriptional regulator